MMNPWAVQSLNDFNFLCCPECLYRSKDEHWFQAHALQNHPQSVSFFKSIDDIGKDSDPLEVANDAIKLENQEFKEENSESDYNEAFGVHVEIDEIPDAEDDTKVITRKPKKPTKSQKLKIKSIRSSLKGNIRKRDKKCLECSEEFGLLSQVEDHMKAQHSGFWCRSCNKGFVNYKKLKNHLNSHVREACRICSQEMTQRNMKRHMQEVHDEGNVKEFACEECSFTTSTQRYLDSHMGRNHGNAEMNKDVKDFACAECTFSTSNRRNMNRHLRNVHGKDLTDSYEEPEPSTRIKKENGAKMHPSDATEPCTECGKELKLGGQTNHYKAMHGIYPGNKRPTHFCDQCPAQFISRTAMTTHIKTKHSVVVKEAKVYKCEACLLDFNSEGMLIQHFKRIHKEIPAEYKDRKLFLCDECPEALLTKSGLKYHKENVHCDPSHKGPKRRRKKTISVCSDCGKKFKTARAFQEHVKVVHEGVTPFACEHCKRKFGLMDSLRSHIQIVHTRITCDVCHQEIYNSFELKRHKASAHGIFPDNVLKCDLCPMFFMKAKNLEHHKESKH